MIPVSKKFENILFEYNIFDKWFSEIIKTDENPFTLNTEEVFKVKGVLTHKTSSTTYKVDRKINNDNFYEMLNKVEIKLSKIPFFNKNFTNVNDIVSGYDTILTSKIIYDKYFYKENKYNFICDESFENTIIALNKSILIINEDNCYFNEDDYLLILLK